MVSSIMRTYGITSSVLMYNIEMLDVTAEENAVLLLVKVVAGASRTRLLGDSNFD